MANKNDPQTMINDLYAEVEIIQSATKLRYPDRITVWDEIFVEIKEIKTAFEHNLALLINAPTHTELAINLTKIYEQFLCFPLKYSTLLENHAYTEEAELYRARNWCQTVDKALDGLLVLRKHMRLDSRLKSLSLSLFESVFEEISLAEPKSTIDLQTINQPKSKLKLR